MIRVSVVVPFYNEVDGIPRLADKLSALAVDLAPDHELECVLVDDGSQDGSEMQAHRCFAAFPHAVFAKHERNRGLGAAMRTGFANTSGEIVVAIDSDCTYDPRQIPRLASIYEPRCFVDVSACLCQQAIHLYQHDESLPSGCDRKRRL